MTGPRDGTLDPDATLEPGDHGDDAPEAPRAVCLTVLHHPDASRVGDIAFVGRRCDLSRTGPSFLPPEGGGGSPLADRYLSRRPIRIEVDDAGAVRIDPEAAGGTVVIDGQAVTASVDIDTSALAAGVTIECAERIALLLHTRRPPRGGVERHGMIGHSEALEDACARIDQVAQAAVPVLVTGPTGTGKELIARALHRASGRPGQFLAVSAATLPVATAASLLFGHVRGAFTGADRPQDGLFAAADQGTLFLDEIGESPLEVQAMLLRALEEGTVLPVGATAPRPVDVRLVAATDIDLAAAVAAARFKSPLLHRLQGFVIRLPPLAGRPDDVGRLLVHFLRAELQAVAQADRLATAPGQATPWLPPSLVASMARHRWPGNVRELRNVARHIVLSSGDRARVAIDDTLRALCDAAPRPDTVRQSGRRSAEVGEDTLIRVLRANRWRAGAAAAELGISRTALYGLMERSPRIRTARGLSEAEIRDAFRDSGGDLSRAAELLEVSERALKLRIRELAIELP